MLFELQTIDPKVYRAKTRRSTLIIMAMFVVIGFIFADRFVAWFGEYSNNLIVLNFIGAFFGLVLTGFFVKWFFKDKPWMAEAMYGWRLKRNLMHVTNRLRAVQEAVERGDVEAMKILRFYHLGLEQMHRLEDNSHALIELSAEKRALEKQLEASQVDLQQTCFDPQWLEPYPLTKEH
jgi:hypothetical protein